MNREGFRELKEVVEPLGYDVTPEPKDGEEVAFFDVTSGEGPISSQRLLNALYQSKRTQTEDVTLIADQPYCFSFVDNTM